MIPGSFSQPASYAFVPHLGTDGPLPAPPPAAAAAGSPNARLDNTTSSSSAGSLYARKKARASDVAFSQTLSQDPFDSINSQSHAGVVSPHYGALSQDQNPVYSQSLGASEAWTLQVGTLSQSQQQQPLPPSQSHGGASSAVTAPASQDDDNLFTGLAGVKQAVLASQETVAASQDGDTLFDGLAGIKQTAQHSLSQSQSQSNFPTTSLARKSPARAAATPANAPAPATTARAAAPVAANDFYADFARDEGAYEPDEPDADELAEFEAAKAAYAQSHSSSSSSSARASASSSGVPGMSEWEEYDAAYAKELAAKEAAEAAARAAKAAKSAKTAAGATPSAKVASGPSAAPVESPYYTGPSSSDSSSSSASASSSTSSASTSASAAVHGADAGYSYGGVSAHTRAGAGLTAHPLRRLPAPAGAALLTRAPATGGFATLTTHTASGAGGGSGDGDAAGTLTRRWYLSVESEAEHAQRLAGVAAAHAGFAATSVAAAGAARGAGLGLLSRPMAEIVAEADADRRRDDIARAQRLAAEAAEAAERAASEKKHKKGGGRRERAAAAASSAQEKEQLLVDKYSPQRYIELLSAEQCNRDVVTWLKQWDLRVFNRPVPDMPAIARPDPPFGAPRPGQFAAAPHHQQQQPKPDWRDGPEQPVILLAGPPGAGKTTLAHVAARHCGYRVIEVNASDDRSMDAVAHKIRGAVETENVMGERRPNLLVLDEIDGALGGDDGESRAAGAGADSAVGLLIEMVKVSRARARARQGRESNDDAKKTRGEDSDSDDDGDKDGKDGAAAAAGKKGNKLGPGGNGVTRPIICICNDPFAPCLRPLLPFVRLIHVEPVSKTRLVSRLTAITAKERIPAEPRALAALADLVNCDVRSALHTLQFVKARLPRRGAKHKAVVASAAGAGDAVGEEADDDGDAPTRLTVAYLSRLSVGEKDMAKNALALWEAVLCTRPIRAALAAPAFEAGASAGVGAALSAPTVTTRAPTTAAAVVAATATSANAGEGGIDALAVLPTVILDHGMVDKVTDGVHHNYLFVPATDPDLARLAGAAEALAWVDSLGPSWADYQPYALLGVRIALNCPRKTALEFPKPASLWRQRRVDAVLDAFFAADGPWAARALPRRDGPLYLFSLLQDILAPALGGSGGSSGGGGGALHLMAATERAAVAALVAKMLAAGLTFTRAPLSFAAASAAGPSMVLSPDLASVTTYYYSRDHAFYGYTGGGLGGRLRYGTRPPPTIFDAYRGLPGLNPALVSSRALDAAGGAFAGAGAEAGTLSAVAPKRRELPSQLKQTLAREVEFERIRREDARRREAAAAAAEEEARYSGSGGARGGQQWQRMHDFDDDGDDDTNNEEEEDDGDEGGNQSRKGKAKAVAEAKAKAATNAAAAATAAETAEKAAAAAAAPPAKPRAAPVEMRSFFQRIPRAPRASTTGAGSGADGKTAGGEDESKQSVSGAAHPPLSYVFLEGFSNAVKRPVKMSGLFG